MSETCEYDLIVIGSGPAGEKAAIHASYHGFKVAMAEMQSVLGGAAINTGTIPSKTLKETALYLSGWRDRGLYSVDRKLEHDPDVRDVLFREKFVVSTEGESARIELLNDKVDLHFGTASFLDAHRVLIRGDAGDTILTGRFILVATGSSPTHPDGIPFDSPQVRDSDSILKIDKIPKSLCIAGAGVIGCEYATVFAALGSKVTLLNGGADLLSFLDREISGLLMQSMTSAGIDVRMNSRVESVTIQPDGGIRAGIGGDGTVDAEMLLFSAGRGGNTASLDCDKVGLKPTKRGLLEVDETYRTTIPNIYAAGDVIGFPALGSTSMDQGRVAVTHMFCLHDCERIASAVPYGIYTIPEVAMVGLTEEKAHEQNIEFYVSRARYTDVPRGVIIGAESGILKILFSAGDHTVLGVHIIGIRATELIHYGMELVECRRDLGHIIGTVFNYPTLHELYKHAAYQAWQDMGAPDRNCEEFSGSHPAGNVS